jgi:transcriptional regulator with XRE-family HTH domain
MADVLGCSRQHVHQIEKGKSVSPETAREYARVLDHNEAFFAGLALEQSSTDDINPMVKLLISHQGERRVYWPSLGMVSASLGKKDTEEPLSNWEPQEKKSSIEGWKILRVEP